MDPFSQGALGASLAQSFAKRPRLKAAAICGMLGGLAPDLDVVIRSQTDPMLALEYHRHFTHSLSFIPIGGLIVAGFIWFVLRYRQLDLRETFLFATLGIATHGLLDSCTAYGTSLLWPFSDLRVSWNTISIVDPIFTLPLIVCVILAARRQSVRIVQGGLAFSLLYMSFGALQHWRVESFMAEVAERRGHVVEQPFVNPMIGNNIEWRSVYRSGKTYYVDGVTAWPFAMPQLEQGPQVAVIDAEQVFPELAATSQQREDVRRFAFFAQNYLYMYPGSETIIGDLRYSNTATGLNSIFGIKVNIETPDAHVVRYGAGSPPSTALSE